ncbi:dynamin family protein [Marimonas sp. MJW-29]|uniref:Dynamin family protein n=1 Tax=Sulfitobacter sediminis TaxID=3234186 RepID=A0ABV3RSU6_9RHOB
MTSQIALEPQQDHKPRVALLGEFSSGKSTLSNLLLGEAPLPMKVTATRLPPVWISYGEPAAYAVSHDGTEREVTLDDINDLCLTDTRFIRLYRTADTLQVCDLIDMPGISDPNMSVENWQPLLAEIDCVIWCTHATQAWRQSEAAMWDEISASTNGNNILLVTQFDKLKNEFERARVMKRLKIETKGKFEEIFSISLLQAIEAGDDFSIWEKSGAAGFIDHLISLILNTSHDAPQTGPESQEPVGGASSSVIVEHVAEVVQDDPSISDMQIPDELDQADVGYVRPRRVRIKTKIRPRTPRPPSRAVGNG